jgi:hypothetical protein
MPHGTHGSEPGPSPREAGDYSPNILYEDVDCKIDSFWDFNGKEKEKKAETGNMTSAPILQQNSVAPFYIEYIILD